MLCRAAAAGEARLWNRYSAARPGGVLKCELGAAAAAPCCWARHKGRALRILTADAREQQLGVPLVDLGVEEGQDLLRDSGAGWCTSECGWREESLERRGLAGATHHMSSMHCSLQPLHRQHSRPPPNPSLVLQRRLPSPRGPTCPQTAWPGRCRRQRPAAWAGQAVLGQMATEERSSSAALACFHDLEIVAAAKAKQGNSPM